MQQISLHKVIFKTQREKFNIIYSTFLIKVILYIDLSFTNTLQLMWQIIESYVIKLIILII